MSPPNSSKTFMPPHSGVTVRMYNPGFGDCLLLAFRGIDGHARYMLIDCGVHHQYPDHEEKVKAVAADIAEATNNRLHLVVATHEHSDHLSGFVFAKEIFDQIEIEDLWMSWTEDPNDKVAQDLKGRAHKASEALTAVVGQLDSLNKPLGVALQGVLEFEMKKDSSPLDYLRSRSRKKIERAEDYRRPGEVLPLPEVSGVKVYILGPPRDKPEYIHIVDDDSQLYPAMRSLREWKDFALAALKASACGASDDQVQESADLNHPFDPDLAISPKDAPKHKEFGKFFQSCYGFTSAKNEGPEWRRLECDWLETAEQLALKLNDYTNNTSLVLAIELTETQPKKVLLFAADAQAGNWLSWRDLSWPSEGQSEEKLTVVDLLKRTVFYKVGHHGSRNATLSEEGLEQMVNPDLVAMIPVDEKWAYDKKPQPWLHPAKTLLEKLTVRAKGRVLRSDKIPQGDQPPVKPNEASAEEWHEFIKELDWDRRNGLWVQFTITG